MNILVVEDNVQRILWFQKEFADCNVTIATNAKTGKWQLDHNQFAVLFLDHDLGNRVYVESVDENTGYQVARFLKGTINKDTPVIVHSWNPAGVENIMSVLPYAKKATFGSFNKSILDSILDKR